MDCICILIHSEKASSRKSFSSRRSLDFDPKWLPVFLHWATGMGVPQLYWGNNEERPEGCLLASNSICSWARDGDSQVEKVDDDTYIIKDAYWNCIYQLRFKGGNHVLRQVRFHRKLLNISIPGVDFLPEHDALFDEKDRLVKREAL